MRWYKNNPENSPSPYVKIAQPEPEPEPENEPEPEPEPARPIINSQSLSFDLSSDSSVVVSLKPDSINNLSIQDTDDPNLLQIMTLFLKIYH